MLLVHLKGKNKLKTHSILHLSFLFVCFGFNRLMFNMAHRLTSHHRALFSPKYLSGTSAHITTTSFFRAPFDVKDNEDFQKRVLASSKPVLVDFHAEYVKSLLFVNKHFIFCCAATLYLPYFLSYFFFLVHQKRVIILGRQLFKVNFYSISRAIILKFIYLKRGTACIIQVGFKKIQYITCKLPIE